MIIRKFQSSDTPQIIQLFRENVHSIGARYYSSEQVAAWAPSEIDENKWLTSLQEHITFVAEKNDHIIGFADITHDGYLDRLYVHKDYQARGVAYRLMQHIEQAAREIGLKKITTHASIAAMPIAKRIGYAVIKEQKVIHNGVELINYIMEKKL